MGDTDAGKLAKPRRKLRVGTISDGSPYRNLEIPFRYAASRAPTSIKDQVAGSGTELWVKDPVDVEKKAWIG